MGGRNQVQGKVIMPDSISEEFNIQTGDTLAPFLFIIVLNYTLRQAIGGGEQELLFTLTPWRSTRHHAETLIDLDDAEDICLLSNPVQQARELLTRMEFECAKVKDFK